MRTACRFITLVAVALLIATRSGASEPSATERPLQLKPKQPYLLADPRLQGKLTGVTMSLHPFQRFLKHPVVWPEHPWEGKTGKEPGSVEMGGTVMYDQDEKVFKMWYDAFTARFSRSFVCYAISRDGIHWTKPKLGLYEYKGSKENNIVTVGNTAGISFVYRDPQAADPAKRWFMWGKQHRPGEHGFPANYGVYRFFSPDGIHWTRESKEPNLPYHYPQKVLGGVMGDAGSTFWLPQLGKHVAIHQTVRPNPRPAPGDPGRKGQRIFVRFDSEDGLKWSKPAVAFDSDEEDLKVDPYHQFYNATITPVGGLFLGILAEYHPNEGTMDLGYAVSADTVSWNRPFHGNPVLPLGPEGAFDSKMINSTAQLIEKDGNWWLYYSGNPWIHHERDPRKQYEAIGLAQMPVGRIVSADAGAEGGIFETPTIEVPDGLLHLNCDAQKGEIRVEVLDAGGRTVQGRSAAECLPVGGDHMDAAVSWSAGPVASLFTAGTTVRLRFHLKDAELFGFRFE